MSWLDDIGGAASKSFAGDKLVLAGIALGVVAVAGAVWWLLGQFGVVDPVFGCAKCEAAKKVKLVVVEFADREGTLAAFGGTRSQYVNLSTYGDGDAQVTTGYKMYQRPPIVVKVSPPMAVTVTLRLVREDLKRGFPGGSEALSAREQGIEHLQWKPEITATVDTDANGDGKLEPGLVLPQTAGFKYHVEGSVARKPFVRSANSVVVKRRFAIRQVVRYAAGQAAAATAVTDMRSDFDPLDVEHYDIPALTGAELGVQENIGLAIIQAGLDALQVEPPVKAFRPYSIAVIVGEFATDTIVPQTFEVEIKRGLDKKFSPSVNLALKLATAQQVLIPLDDGSQFVSGSVSHGDTPTIIDLQATEVSDLSRFVKSVKVDLSRILPMVPSSAPTLTVSVKLKAIGGWAVGWAYNSYPVIYLNMRDPDTNNLLTPGQATALMVHELGHKLRLTSPGEDVHAPDQPPHYYPSFDKDGRKHTGPHCSTGVPTGTDLWTQAAEDAATCTMWGALKGTRNFCPECKTTLRKVNLVSGF